MREYLNLLEDILENGIVQEDRTGTGTLSIFGRQMRFDLSKGFPLVTTKKVHMKSIIHELLWFLSGDTNIKYLNDNGVTIWDEWADKNGDLGPIYGHQWRKWTTYEMINNHVFTKQIDQIKEVVKNIIENPSSRRMIVSGWNVGDLARISKAPPPCHTIFQFYVANGKLSCQLYQRSADFFLGVPFNIASYALLVMMIAQVTGLKPGEFVHTFGDAHIYSNHIKQVKTQLSREPFELPTMKLNQDVTDIFDFKYEDFSLENYKYHPRIKAKISI